MVIGVGKKFDKYSDLNVGTYSGIFHCDEVVGISIIEIAKRKSDIYVVRTRDKEELQKLDIVIDVGGGEFDHHVKGFDLRRENGIKYASAGLMWKKYGKEAIETVMARNEIFAWDDEIDEAFEIIDRDFIIPVDMEDNGENDGKHIFSFIPKFLPTWLEDEDADYDKSFGQVQEITTSILENCIKHAVEQVLTRIEIDESIAKLENGVLFISSQNVPWIEYITNYNKNNDNAIKFVVFPYPTGGYAAQCVPPSMEERFKQIVPFPEEWAGGNEETLPKISGFEDAVFCHNGRFFARAKSKETIMGMCTVALKNYTE